ncbi:MAG: STAS domain-containing protein [Umezawaea sp.]
MIPAVPRRISVLPLPRTAHRAPSQSAPTLLNVTPRLVQPGAVMLVVRGEVDMTSSPYLWEHVHEHVHHGGPDVILDLTEVTFFGAAGLTILAKLREAASLVEIGFSVVATARAVLWPLRITGLDLVLDVYPDLHHIPMRSWPPIGLR